ncbi:MAG: PIN domain-containing protein [Nitrospirota bacterium]
MGDDVLVDTSAWIASFREKGNDKLKDFLRSALELDHVVTTNIVVLELLQGCKARKEYNALKERLDILPLFALDENAWALAYEAGYGLRRKGITVPTVDILICSIAKAHALKVLHHDDHMRSLARELGIKAVDFLKTGEDS